MTSGEQGEAGNNVEERNPPIESMLILGLVGGLVIAAVVCLVYGWLHRTPNLPLAEDFSSLTSVLWRTTFVTVGAFLLVVGYLVFGRPYRRSATRRAKFVALTAPVLLVVAVAALAAQYRGGATRAFQAAYDAQIALHPFSITTVARSAWWFACSALVALALLCVTGYSSVHSARSQRIPKWWAAAAVTLIVPVVLAVPVMWSATKSPFHGETAERIDAPALTGLRGEAAYRVEMGTLATYARTGGAGWVRVAEGSGWGAETVEGYDGATGERRWWFTTAGLKISNGGVRTTGIGPDSVALVKAYAPNDALLALDATTGELLWARVDHATFDEDYPLSASVILLATEGSDGGRQWDALSPRTGETMWTKTFQRGCSGALRAFDSAVLMNTCDDGPDVVAQVLDPKTGQTTGAITAATLGIAADRIDSERGLSIGSVRGNRALIYGAGNPFVIDIPSGRVLAGVPDGYAAEFIDTESLMLTRPVAERNAPKPVSLLDLRDGAVIDTGLFQQWLTDDEGWQLIAHVGDRWLTLLPDAEWVAQLPAKPGIKPTGPAMRIIDKTGQAEILPYPCEGPFEAAPYVSSVPGAVLVVCGVLHATAAGIQ